MQLPLDKLSVRGGFWAWMPRARCSSSMPPTTIWRSRHLNFHTAVALHVLPLSPCAAHALGGRCLKVWGHSSAIAQACFASRWLPLLLLEPTLRRRYGQMGSQLPETTQKRVHWPGASAESWFFSHKMNLLDDQPRMNSPGRSLFLFQPPFGPQMIILFVVVPNGHPL